MVRVAKRIQLKKRGLLCEPKTLGFPADTEKRAINAIVRARQFRTGTAQKRIIRCACRILARKFGRKKEKATPTCRHLGF